MHIYIGNRWTSLIVIVAGFQAMGGLMGWITSHGVDDWYQGLARSPLNPPDWAFGVAWTVTLSPLT